MTNLRQSFEAAKYHKKMTMASFVLFTLLLMAMTLISQLKLTQSFTLTYLLNKWEQLKLYFPQLDTELNKELTKTNTSMIRYYNEWYFVLSVFSFILFLVFSFYMMNKRKAEIYSLTYIGVRRIQIFFRMVLETIFPVISGLFVSLVLLLIFQTPFVNQSLVLNQQLMNHYFEEQMSSQPQIKKKEATNVVAQSNNDTIQLATPDETEVLPYNKTSILNIRITENTLTHSGYALIKNFFALYLSLLLAFALSFICFMKMFLNGRRFFE